MPDLKTHADFLTATMERWLAKRDLPMTNEMIRNSYVFGDIWRAGGIDLQGGQKATAHLMVGNEGSARFVAPREPKLIKQSEWLRKMSVDWAFLEAHPNISEKEMLLNEGPERIVDQWRTTYEAELTYATNVLDDSFLDPIGNADKLSLANRPAPGVKFWVPRDGLALSASAGGATTILGIDLNTFKNFRSTFIGPLGHNCNSTRDADTTRTITSANQLMDALALMARSVRFQSPAGVSMGQDDKTSDWAKSQRIYCDGITMDFFEKYHRSGHDQFTSREINPNGGMPVWRGIPLTYVQQLGLGSDGVPAGAATGSMLAGSYPNTGELFMLNMKNFKILGRSGYMPNRSKIKVHEDTDVLFQDVKWWFTTICVSRRRCGTIWGYSPATA